MAQHLDHDERSFREEEARTRSKLANERTFGAWLRTGLSVMVVGLAIARFMTIENGPLQTWFVALGSGYVLAGVGLYVFAVVDYFQSRKAMKRERYHAPKKALIAIATIIALLSVALLVLIAIQHVRQ